MIIWYTLHTKQRKKWQNDIRKKHRENRKNLPREHIIGCWGVKLFLLKDVTIITVTTATVTTVTFTTVTIGFFWALSQFDFWFFSPIWVFEFCYNLSFWVLSHSFLDWSQFGFLSFFTIFGFEFCHNLNFRILFHWFFLVLS